jgi:hypothetical protein
MIMILCKRWIKAARPGLLLLVVAAAISTGSSRVRAGTQGWTTTTAVPPGGILTVDVTQSGVNISGSTSVPTCPIVSSIPSDIVTYDCDGGGTGIPVGTRLVQTWADPAGADLPGPYSETVTYNAPGSFPTRQDGPTKCNNAETSQDPYTVDWTCSINVLPTQYPQELTVYLLASDQSLVLFGEHGMTLTEYTPSLAQSYIEDEGLGGCPMDSNNTSGAITGLTYYLPAAGTSLIDEITGLYYNGSYAVYDFSPPALSKADVGNVTVGSQQWGSEIKAAFDCTNGDPFQAAALLLANPANLDKIPIPTSPPDSTGRTLEFDVGSAVTGPDGSPVTVAIAQIARTVATVSQTTQTVYGQAAPSLTSISPSSGPAGSTVTLSGMNLVAFALTFGANPGHSTPLGPSLGTTVLFNQQPATNVTCNASGTSCTATTPAGGNPGDQYTVTVKTSAGQSNGVNLTITGQAPLASTSTAATTATPAVAPTATPAAWKTATPASSSTPSSTSSATASPTPSGRH